MGVLVEKHEEKGVGEYRRASPPRHVICYPVGGVKGIDEVGLALQWFEESPEVGRYNVVLRVIQRDGTPIRRLATERAVFISRRNEPLSEITEELLAFGEPFHGDVIGRTFTSPARLAKARIIPWSAEHVWISFSNTTAVGVWVEPG
jgi:hypothetical protein